MNDYTLGNSNRSGLFGGLVDAAGAVAGAINAFRDPAPQTPPPATRPVPVNAPLGVPVIGWILGGLLLVVGLFVALRK